MVAKDKDDMAKGSYGKYKELVEKQTYGQTNDQNATKELKIIHFAFLVRYDCCIYQSITTKNLWVARLKKKEKN